MPFKYTCCNCGGEFVSDWTDEEAQAEREQQFPGVPEKYMVVVCDDCYQKIMTEHGHVL
jgi:DNA-directed RNA polymerase subunit RPC12/RpoP